MTDFVADCSVTAAWFIEQSKYATDTLKLLSGCTAWVPCLWQYEFVNVLTQAHKRKTITQAQVEGILDRVFLLPIKIDITPTFALRRIFELATKYALTSYDAAYLELCLRQGLPLASLDSKLIAAATNSGVHIVR